MKKLPCRPSLRFSFAAATALGAALTACSTDPSSAPAQGGSSAGGFTTSTGGNPPASGGATTGGIATGGIATGGIATGGTAASTGGAPSTTGGSGNGGTLPVTGGSATGGTSSGGNGIAGSAAGGAAGASSVTGGLSGNTGGAGGATGGTGGKGSAGAAGASAGSTGMLCPANALFCEDFEDGNLDGWTNSPSGGTLAITGMKPANGTKSLQIDVPAQQYGGALIRKGAPLFPLPNKRFWGRLMVYFDTVADGHTDIIRGAATGGGTPQYNVGEQHGEILLNYYAGSASDCWARPKPGKVIPLKTWMCWEWSFDGAANQMQFYIDGTLSRQVDGTGDGCLQNPTQTWTAPTFAELRIGEYIAERSPNAQRIWIDDIAVSTESRVACPAR